MTRRLRVLAERPLDPATARIVAILGGAVCVGFAALVGLGLIATGSPRPIGRAQGIGSQVAIRPSSTDRGAPTPAARPPRSAQDPQDRPDTPAARRARRELAGHRALQHVPLREEGVSISLVGAHAGRAVLAVRGPGIAADRRAWRSFLHRFHDDGHSYLPRLLVVPRAPAVGDGRAGR